MTRVLPSTLWRPGSHRRPSSWPGALLGSLLAHAAAFAVVWRTVPAPEPPEPPEQTIELALLAEGPGDEPGPAPGPKAPAAAMAPPRPAPTPSPAPASPPAPAEAPASDEAAPTTFPEWQLARRSRFLGSPGGFGGAAGGDGTDLATRRGRDRCEPPPSRQSERLYLLFDASGSMDDNGRADALSCAQQYAASALARGSTVVVGTFARDAVFSSPTASLAEVRAALRAEVRHDATVLPARQLGNLLDRGPIATSELVVVSDGWFRTDPELLVWFRYFLDVDPDNRATLFTVRNDGQQDAVARLKSLGFDVYTYDPVRY